jgi:hypothetical protein
MTLADLRRLAVRQQFRIHFRLRNGMECVVTDHGVAHVPNLNSRADFNLEEELAAAAEFLLEPAAPPDKKNPARPRTVQREELAKLAAAPPAAAAPDHDDE